MSTAKRQNIALEDYFGMLSLSNKKAKIWLKCEDRKSVKVTYHSFKFVSISTLVVDQLVPSSLVNTQKGQFLWTHNPPYV